MHTNTDHPHVVLNPFIIYFGLAVAAVLLQKYLPLPFIPAQAARITGAVMVVLNFIFGLPALIGMLRAKTSPNPGRPATSLLLSGPYKISRNPMYIGLTLLFAGLLFYFQNPWGLFFVPAAIWLITVWVVLPEEKYLEKKFGEEYIRYRSSVRRWI